MTQQLAFYAVFTPATLHQVLRRHWGYVNGKKVKNGPMSPLDGNVVQGSQQQLLHFKPCCTQLYKVIAFVNNIKMKSYRIFLNIPITLNRYENPNERFR